MRLSIFKKVWESSPGSFCRAVKRRIAARQQIPAWVRVQSGPLKGGELFLPATTSGLWKEMYEGTFDRFIYQALSKIDLAGCMIWDVGAHVGYHSLAFSALGADVLAFEPNTHNAARFKAHLERNADLAQRIRHSPLALSDQDGETIFVQSDDMGGQSSGSHLENAVPPLEAQAYSHFEQTPVKTAKIDTLIDMGERPPDIIKVDVEGAEHLVLRGGAKFFASQRPVLLMEVHNISLMFHVQKYLSKAGFETVLADEEHSSTSRCFILASKSSALFE